MQTGISGNSGDMKFDYGNEGFTLRAGASATLDGGNLQMVAGSGTTVGGSIIQTTGNAGSYSSGKVAILSNKDTTIQSGNSIGVSSQIKLKTGATFQGGEISLVSQNIHIQNSDTEAQCRYRSAMPRQDS